MSTNRNLLKKFLTTTSALAVIAGGIEMAEAAARQIIVNNGNLNTGQNLNLPLAAFADHSTLAYNGAFKTISNRANLIVEAIDVNGQVGTIFFVVQPASLGSVVDTGGVNTLAATINQGKALTLTGTTSGGLGFAAAADTYNALGDITFVGANSTLTVAAAGPITLNGAFVNPGNGVLNVNSALTLTNVSGALINAINIGAGQSLTFDVGNNSLAPLGAGAIFVDADSTMAFKVNANGGKNVTFAAAFDPVGGANDDKGKVIFENTAASGGGHLLTVDIGGANLGNANDHRLRQISTLGTCEIKFQNGDIFAKLISIGGTEIQSLLLLTQVLAAHLSLPQ